MMIALQSQGCHNINLVSPTHVVVQIMEALPFAIDAGLRVPLVYNTGGYDSRDTLGFLDGIVDIYMPDYKFTCSEVAKRVASAPDYPEIVREAIREMHRQVGDLRMDEQGIAKEGLLVRHLVLPEDAAGTFEAMNWISTHISPHTYVNIMDQYRPCGSAHQHPPLARRITPREYQGALDAALSCGLNRLDERAPPRIFFLR
jgi:putative pyruvate formate lyase activating enzyme